GVKQKGLELELDGRWPNGVRTRLSYALQESKDVDTGKFLLNSPKHLVKLNSVVPLWSDKLFLGLEEQFTARRKTLTGSASKYFITNLTLFSQNLFEGLEASASVYNVFNQKYQDPSSGEHLQDRLKQDGTTFRFKLTFRF
ncbi:MAG: TonB-dependent receptor, partial [Deltaproteobacteria bacterium]|nr:TonB-dependent receptor [Deltaproteobacteria bacterium]